ncbi:hypothetical protein K8R32_04140 [bacterium]|nr:hypothetical protein [bacterium]
MPKKKKVIKKKPAAKKAVKKAIKKKPAAKKAVKKAIKKKPAAKKAVKKAVKKKPAAKKAVKKAVKKAGKKVIEKHEVIKPTEEQIDKIILKAKSRGFITETELLYVFPEVEEYVFDYEIFLEDLEDNGIQIIEDTGRFLDNDEKKDAETAEILHTKNLTDLSKLSADSIQMYLKV